MPASKIKKKSKVLKTSKGTNRHDTSTPIRTSRGTHAKSSKSDKTSPRENEYDIAKEMGGNSRYCKFSVKQRRNWRALDRNTIQHLYTVIDCAVKTVGSQPLVINDEDVQDTLSQMKLKLKSKLHRAKVPNKKSSSIATTQAKMLALRERAEHIRLQTCEIEQEIRQEERKIEALEGAPEKSLSSGPAIWLKVPQDELQLPPMMFPNK